MLVPLYVLAVGAALSGVYFAKDFVGEEMSHFWGHAILVLENHSAAENAHHVAPWVVLAPLVVALAGIALAYLMYIRRPDLPAAVAGRFRGLYLFLFNKWYFDELYDRLFVRTANRLGYGFWKSGDGALIDGVGPDGVAAATIDLARRAGRLQSGYVYHYAFAMLIGVFALITWYLFASAG
jgi:NADH-quinone oxidoreductase subunit L